MPALPWRPRFDYGTGPTTLLFTVPMRIWERSLAITGGADRAATWLGASYEVSRAYLLRVTLRYHESEEENVLTMVDYLRSWPQTGTFYPDQLDLGTSFDVDVELPRKGDDLQGRPDPNYPDVREIDVTLRSTVGAPFAITWF
jgi:hypothetical protein